jgi:hypothetical protein
MSTRLSETKIPEVTVLFWVMKIAATTLGETGGDLLAQTMKTGADPGVADGPERGVAGPGVVHGHPRSGCAYRVG